jgi:hypothetical protein
VVHCIGGIAHHAAPWKHGQEAAEASGGSGSAFGRVVDENRLQRVVRLERNDYKARRRAPRGMARVGWDTTRDNQPNRHGGLLSKTGSVQQREERVHQAKE